MNNDQEQDRGEFEPAPTVFNDLASLKYKTTVGPIESAMREQRIQDNMTGYKSKRAAAQDKLAQPEQETVAWPCVIAEANFEQNTITLEMQCSNYKVSAGKHWLSTTPPQPEQERNFCPRCGKRTQDIHTCTPPQEKNT